MARSLKDTCFSLLNYNIEGLVDIGDMDYMLLRPVLLNIDDPHQLREIEQNSPQILGYSGEIWRKMINKHFESKLIQSQGDLTPKKPENWWRVYERLEALKQEEEQAAEEFLRRRMADHNQAKDANMIKAPTQVLKPKSSTTSHWSSSYGSAPRPRTAMAKIKRATANVAAQRRQGPVSTPLPSSLSRKAPPPVRSGIVRAPQHMIDAARKTEAEKARVIDSAAATNRRRIPLFRAPPPHGDSSTPTNSTEPFSKASVLEREARLNRLKMGTIATAASPTAVTSPPVTARPSTIANISITPTSLLSASAAARQQQGIRKVMTTSSRPRDTASASAEGNPPLALASPLPKATPPKRPLEGSGVGPNATTNSPKRKRTANDSFLRSASRPSIGRSLR